MNELLLDTELDADQRRYACAIQESGDSLLSVINDILDISKLEAGKVELENLDFNLGELVESITALLARKAQEKGVDVCVYVDPAVRGAFRGDPNRLRQVLLNLIGNGIKFTDRGSVGIEVSAVSDDRGKRVVRFEISDTGIGIPETVRVQLFQKFMQADNSITRRYGGTGLGLAISKVLVEIMGGLIGADSVPGAGSVFYFELPMTPAEGPVAERDVNDLDFPRSRILIVDDIAMNLQILSRQLNSLGMKVDVSTGASDALAKFEQAEQGDEPYDIVFTDQMMPGMAGDALARELRRRFPSRATKLVLVSSAGLYDRREMRILFDAILEKPLRYADLVNCLVKIAIKTGSSLLAHRAGDAVAPPRNQRIEVAKRPFDILVAEDNKINQQYLQALLHSAGHKVDIVENGRQAVDAVQSRNYDVVLMDLQMPELDGDRATRLIRALPSPLGSIKIIALTADAMAGTRERCLAAGMDDYVSKPINRMFLLSKLGQLAVGSGVSECDEEAAATGDVDLGQLEALRKVLLPGVFAEQLSLLLASFAPSLERIGGFLDAGQLEEGAREAHDLVSTAGNYGVRRVSELARALEHACKRAEPESAARQYADLKPAVRNARATLEQLRRRLTPTG